jgi:hypothetical protein
MNGVRIFLLALTTLWIGTASCAHARVGHEVPLDSGAAPTEAQVEKAIAEGDHRTLAGYYRALAETERRRAAMHEKMARSYGASPHYRRFRKNLAVPCRKLRYDALDRAREYDRLAEEEEELLNP